MTELIWHLFSRLLEVNSDEICKIMVRDFKILDSVLNVIRDNKNETMPPFVMYQILLTLEKLTKKEFLRKEDVKTIFFILILTIFENSGDSN